MIAVSALEETAAVESDVLRVVVLPLYGAKVTELTDKRTGRNWLTTGEPTEAEGDDAVFGGRESYGWDECFPTIGVKPAPMPGWSSPPRDHGMLWGRPWTVRASAREIAASFVHEDFTFSRMLAVDGNRLRASYTLQSHVDDARPYLWSAHPDFALLPGERIELPGVRSMAATYLRQKEKFLAGGEMEWPSGTIGGTSTRLDEVHPLSAGFAAKLYSRKGEPTQAVVHGGGRLVMAWDRTASPYLGLWLDYGGWPDEAPIHQVAIEPTTAPADDLWSAMEQGVAATLPPRGSVDWWIEIALEPE